MKLFQRILSVIVLAAASASAQAVSFVIDDFSTNQQILLNGGASTTDTVFGSMLGGSRTITADATSGAGGFALAVQTGAFSPTANTLDVANNSATAGVVTVTWDAAGAGLGGIDLTSGGIFNTISIDVLTIDTTTTVEFFLTDTLAVTGSIGPSSFAGQGSFNVLLSDYAAQGVDITSINSVSMVLAGQVGWDGAFDLIEVVALPSPTPLALMGLSVLAFGLVKRSKR